MFYEAKLNILVQNPKLLIFSFPHSYQIFISLVISEPPTSSVYIFQEFQGHFEEIVWIW